MVTSKQKPIVDSQKIKKGIQSIKLQKIIIHKGKQQESKKGTLEIQNNWQLINDICKSSMSVITLNYSMN